MKFLILSISLLLFAQINYYNCKLTISKTASNDKFKTIKDSILLKMELQPFVLDGYETLDFEFGNLNNDSLVDCVLNQIGEDTISTAETNRILLVLTRNTFGKLEISCRNDNAIFCYNCGGSYGDPFEGIQVYDHGFSIYHYGGSAWRWTNQAYFNFTEQKNTWELDSLISHSYYSGGPPDSTMSISVKTKTELGCITFDEYNYNN